MVKDFNLNIWRLHPKSCRVEKAEKSLSNQANPGGLKFCKPYTLANALGWWIYPPIDMDITFTNGKFSCQQHETYYNTEHQIVKALTRDTDFVDINKFCPDGGRSKLTFGELEPNILQIWTGCIFETPPGWCLHVRNPINLINNKISIMEGILETDWMQYDIWLNVIFLEELTFKFNKLEPIAQIVPIRRESAEANWQIDKNETINRETPESNRVFEYWLQYNQKKYGSGGNQALTEDLTKDSTTFHREKKRIMDKDALEPKPEQICPFRKKNS